MPRKFNSDWIERNVYYQEFTGEIGSEKCKHFKQYERPVIVCLCGSTRFMQEFYDANMRESLAGNIVLSVGMSSKGDCKPTEEQKVLLDALHFRKIELADAILVLNRDGYVGSSTRNEINHAKRCGKTIRWLEPNKIPPEFTPSSGSDTDPDIHGY